MKAAGVKRKVFLWVGYVWRRIWQKSPQSACFYIIPIPWGSEVPHWPCVRTSDDAQPEQRRARSQVSVHQCADDPTPHQKQADAVPHSASGVLACAGKVRSECACLLAVYSRAVLTDPVLESKIWGVA